MLENNSVRNLIVKRMSALTTVPALTTAGQSEKAPVFKRPLHFTRTKQTTKQFRKLVPRFTIRDHCKGFNLVVFQLQRLNEIA